MSSAAAAAAALFSMPLLRRRRHHHHLIVPPSCCLANTHTSSSPFHLPPSPVDDYLRLSRSASQTSLPDLHFPPLTPAGDTEEDADDVWFSLRREAELDSQDEPALRSFYQKSVLSHTSLECSLASYLAAKLVCSNHLVPVADLTVLFLQTFAKDPSIGVCVRADLRAARDRDAACSKMVHCFLYYKGFLALQSHRVAHRLWLDGRRALALFLQGRASEVFAVDIHPGATVGSGILLDHATGLVIGETAAIGDDVSILHNVTLGGTGKESGDRHPKIGDGVLVGAGTQILGSVRVGEGAKIGAGSVVLKEVPPRTTAVGNPAKLVGGKENPLKLEGMPSLTMDHTSWSDYVI